MSNRLEPVHYNNLAEIVPAAWSLLKDGVTDRTSGSHIVQVATLNAEGLPTIRSVVLRAFDEETRTLRFHTDHRSEKANEIAKQPQIEALVYNRVDKIQLRLRCFATLHHGDMLSADAWRLMAPMSRECYRQFAPPGDTLDLPMHANKQSNSSIDEAYDNFAVVSATIQRLEWLYLSAAGHRRASVDWRSGEGIKSWLAP